MKKLYLLLLLCTSIGSFAQETSLVVDCQNPGWLSSLIPYSQQQTLENLKISGYINGTDLKFIRNLNSEFSLHGVLNLEDANIVSGGDSFYTVHWNMNYSQDLYTKNNELPNFAFANLNSFQKIILPKSLTAFNDDNGKGYQFIGTYVDTLVINGTMETLSVGDSFNSSLWKIRCVYFPDGIKTLYLSSLFYPSLTPANPEIFLPSSLESVYSTSSLPDCVLHCSSTEPENIIENWKNLFPIGKIYVPKGTIEKYKNSIFGKLDIIENVFVEKITIAPYINTMFVNETQKLNATIYPENSLNKNFRWISSNDTIASIDSLGLVVSKSSGNVKIFARSDENNTIVDSCEIHIYDRATGIAFDTTQCEIDDIGKEYEINVHVLPETALQEVSWKSFNESVCTIVNGKILATGEGSTLVQAISQDGEFVASCKVVVNVGLKPDVNKDGVVNSADVVTIYNYIINGE